jgi:hypothetical protein
MLLLQHSVLSGVGVFCVTYRRVLDLMIGFIDTLLTQLWTRGNYSAIADLYILQFTVAHALGFSVFINLILATDFHTVVIREFQLTAAHMNPILHTLVPFLPFLLSHLPLLSPELGPIQILVKVKI